VLFLFLEEIRVGKPLFFSIVPPPAAQWRREEETGDTPDPGRENPAPLQLMPMGVSPKKHSLNGFEMITQTWLISKVSQAPEYFIPRREDF
jgi:hypothetical protein